MLRIFQNTHIDFIRLSRWTSLVIAVFLLPALIWILVSGFKLGIEFTGGTMAEIRFKQAPDVADVRAAVASAGVGNADIQTFGAPTDFVIRAQGSDAVNAQDDGAESVMKSIAAALTARFGEGSFTEVGSEAISASVGQELRGDALVALLISFAVSLIYLAWRFDWRLSLAAVLANVHDIIATIAFIKYAGIEVNLFVVGGVLTVIGYSLNDKVVVFDRVREILRSTARVPLRDTLNRAINETLPRTVLTGTTVLACLLSLILLGGPVLRDFALVLFFGIVVGTFSSIYVAGPVLLMIEKRWPRIAPSSGARPRSDRPQSRAARDTVAAP